MTRRAAILGGLAAGYYPAPAERGRQAHGRQTAGLPTRIAAASWSPVTRAQQYRVKAEECRDQAERARVPGVREQWLRLASQWERLAKEAERQSGQFAEQPGVSRRRG